MERISADAIFIANAIKEGTKEIAKAIRENKMPEADGIKYIREGILCKEAGEIPPGMKSGYENYSTGKGIEVSNSAED